MKIIKTGSTYQIYGEDLIVLDKLPAQTYKIGFSKFTGFFLEKQHDLETRKIRYTEFMKKRRIKYWIDLKNLVRIWV